MCSLRKEHIANVVYALFSIGCTKPIWCMYLRIYHLWNNFHQTAHDGPVLKRKLLVAAWLSRTPPSRLPQPSLLPTVPDETYGPKNDKSVAAQHGNA